PLDPASGASHSGPTSGSAEHVLGMGSGDRFEVSQGDSGRLEGGCGWPTKRCSCRKNAVASAVPQFPRAPRILHGKEGVEAVSSIDRNPGKGLTIPVLGPRLKRRADSLSLR